jgi:hypothetical protein
MLNIRFNNCDPTVNTYGVWLRYELSRGRLDDTGFGASEPDLAEFPKRHEYTKQLLSGMVAKAPQ